jgi:hypothetical protein
MADNVSNVPRQIRRARNRELFRQVNESIADLDRLSAETHSLICECRRLGCVELVEVPAAVFAAVKDEGATFVVRNGHEEIEHEVVVADHGLFLVVRDR